MPQTIRVAAIASACLSSAAYCSADDIQAVNSPSIVYLQVTDTAGNFVEGGTGFIVSHDGYVVTADHIQVGDGQKLYAVIGQREGTRFPLSFRDHDEANDIAIWQLPQAPVCRPAVMISTKPVAVGDTITVLGFPGTTGLSPAFVHITNTASPEHGFYKVDGLLQEGNSGGPAFDVEGGVVAIVQGGTMPGTEQNDLVPISFAIALLSKHGVQAGIDTSLDFGANCYSICRDPSHGIEGWSKVEAWSTTTGRFDGGHTRDVECQNLIGGAIARSPGSTIDLAPDPANQQTHSRKDILGHVEYWFDCAGERKTGPIYKKARSSACPLQQ